MIRVAESPPRPGSHVLTPRQRAILQFIEEYVRKFSVAPKQKGRRA